MRTAWAAALLAALVALMLIGWGLGALCASLLTPADLDAVRDVAADRTVALDGTVVSVANPTIQRELHSTLAGLQWVTNGYLLALAVFLIPGGKLGDRLGRRLIFSLGITGFALASLGCARSPPRSECWSPSACARASPARC